MTPIDRVVARDEIQQLAYAYADGVDRRDLDLLASLYRPDARFGDHGEGAAGCRSFFDESLGHVGIAVLLVANHLIEFDSCEPGSRPTASGTVWAHGFIDDGAEGFIQQLIKYDDRYIRADDRWCFTRRRHFLWLGWPHNASDPLGQSPADWPKRQVGLGSIPYDDGTWQEYWAERS